MQVEVNATWLDLTPVMLLGACPSSCRRCHSINYCLAIRPTMAC